MEKQTLKIYTDGGSRGNPGPSALGFVVIKDGKIIHKGSRFLGTGTNNEAEYSALIDAYKWLIEKIKVPKIFQIFFYLDSELVVKQLNGLYKIKSSNLKPYFFDIKKYEKLVDATKKYVSIPREQNKLADEMVNEELDKVLF